MNMARHFVTIPVNQKVVAWSLWTLSAVLMIVETFDDDGGIAGWWSILVAIGAATVTVVCTLGAARRVGLEVMSWEHQRTRAEVREVRDGVSKVVQIH